MPYIDLVSTFMLNTPLAYSRLIGQQDGFPGEKMRIPLAKSVGLWDAHINACEFPIREQTEVVCDVQRQAAGIHRVRAGRV